jgi:hypothetical protein
VSRVRSEGGDYGTLLRELGVDREIDACNNGDNMPIQEVTGESDFGGRIAVVSPRRILPTHFGRLSRRMRA